MRQTLFAALWLFSVAPAAWADCVSDARDLMPQARQLPNQMASRAAMQELRTAIEDGTEDSDEMCLEPLASARRIIRDQPFDWRPGDKIDHPDKRGQAAPKPAAKPKLPATAG